MEAPIRPLRESEAPMRAAARLLASIHPTCSHDLPNQILSLQSLINLIEMDEAERLDSSGREYLRRLRTVADKIDGLTTFLKEMVRLPRQTPRTREIVLTELFRELQAEARSVLKTPIRWDIRLTGVTIRADHDLIYPSIGDLLRTMVEGDAQTPRPVKVTSSFTSRRAIVEIAVGGIGMDRLSATMEQRTEVILARERLRHAGVGLSFGRSRPDEASIVFDFMTMQG